jgi:imidazolonepropionase
MVEATDSPTRPKDLMHADLLIHSASQMLTLDGGPQRGERFGQLGIIEDGALAVQDGAILAVGTTSELQGAYTPTTKIDAAGRVVMPGFVDPHTHLIWAGDRASEFEQRVSGATYMEIMAAGGGILSTVRETRAASVDSLVEMARPRLHRMLEHGTTTAEAKTGYGLAFEPELRMLEAILLLDRDGPWELVPTFLPAHALPTEYQPDRTNDYVNVIASEMLPALLEWWTEHHPNARPPFVDVFCEKDVFDLEQSRRVLKQAQALGFPLKIHADEFASLGGTRLAVELGAASADHLVRTPDTDIAALGKSDTVAVALPATPFGLAEEAYTPASEILAAGGILALATDLNPGTAWCESMQLILALATRYMGLTPAQAIAASTVNAAYAIQREASVGSLAAGKQADILIIEAPDYRHLGYRFGTNLVRTVLKKGQIVVDRSKDAIR